jgi:hypothetical protein
MNKLKIGPNGGLYILDKGKKKYISSFGNDLEKLETLLSCMKKNFNNNPDGMKKFAEEFAWKFCGRHKFFCLRNSPKLLEAMEPPIFAEEALRLCRANPELCDDAYEIIKDLIKKKCKL